MRRLMTAMGVTALAAAAAGAQGVVVPGVAGELRDAPRVQIWVVDDADTRDDWSDLRDPYDRYDSRRVGDEPVARVRLSAPGYLTVLTVDREGAVRVMHPLAVGAERMAESTPLTLRLRARSDDDVASEWGYVVAFASASLPRYEHVARDGRWRTLRVARPERLDPSDAVAALARELYPDARTSYDVDFAFVSDLGGRRTTAWRSPYLAECADAAARWGYSPWGLWSSLDSWCQRYAYSAYGPWWPYGRSRWQQQPAPPPPGVIDRPVGDDRDMAARDARRGLRPAGPPPTPMAPLMPEQRQRDEPWGRGTVPRPAEGELRPAERDTRWKGRSDDARPAAREPAAKATPKPAARDAVGARRASEPPRARSAERTSRPRASGARPTSKATPRASSRPRTPPRG